MAAEDTFAGCIGGLDSPAPNGAGVTPDDDADLDYVTRAIYVGGAGDLVVTMQGGGDVTLKAVPVGTTLAVRVTRVKSTGTTATQLVALW